MAGGAVGPVEVLYREEDQALLREALEQGQESLEDAGLGGLAADAIAEAGQHGREGHSQGIGEGVEGGVAVAQQGPERADQRRIGQLALPELDAVADQHERVALARPPDQLVEEARLPDAGLAGDEHE